jgi:dihydrofolate reductase
MFNGQKVIYVSIIDNQSKMMPNLKTRIWHHQKLVNRLLREETCIMGRRTFEITRWKGPKSWVLTSDKKWQRSGIGTIHHLDDIHLHSSGPIYILGGISLFMQLKKYVDQIHMYVINSDEGSEPWIEINMPDWKPSNYTNRGIWSYAHLKLSKGSDPHGLNKEIFEI